MTEDVIEEEKEAPEENEMPLMDPDGMPLRDEWSAYAQAYVKIKGDSIDDESVAVAYNHYMAGAIGLFNVMQRYGASPAHAMAAYTAARAELRAYAEGMAVEEAAANEDTPTNEEVN